MRNLRWTPARCFLCHTSIAAPDLRKVLEKVPQLPEPFAIQVAVSCPTCVGRVIAYWSHLPVSTAEIGG